MNLVCQSCERCPATVTEPAHDGAEPYSLCKECHARLLAYSLRPLEWFNLAKRYGPAEALLYDDFYDRDGRATQPELEVDWALLPAPSLGMVSHDAETLLDFSIARGLFLADEADVQQAWKRLPAEQAVDTLLRRHADSHNSEVRASILEVAAILGAPAAGLVRQAWQTWTEDGTFWSLVHASAACLPFREGFALTVNAWEAVPDKARRNDFLALAYFRSPEVLDWIERHAGEPVTDTWGALAARSGFSWNKAEDWLNRGRPLNLIAIDALLEIAVPQTHLLKSVHPELVGPADGQAMAVALRQAAENDPVPRVRQRIDALLARLPDMFKPQ
jgi:hypothetical protein